MAKRSGCGSYNIRLTCFGLHQHGHIGSTALKDLLEGSLEGEGVGQVDGPQPSAGRRARRDVGCTRMLVEGLLEFQSSSKTKLKNLRQTGTWMRQELFRMTECPLSEPYQLAIEGRLDPSGTSRHIGKQAKLRQIWNFTRLKHAGLL